MLVKDNIRQKRRIHYDEQPVNQGKDILFMRIRPYIPNKDYEYLSKWIDDERIHAFWRRRDTWESPLFMRLPLLPI